MQAQLKGEFSGYQKLQEIADRVFERNEEKVVLDTNRDATLAATALYAKGRKCARAIHLLASEGYGEDALILGRSFINLVIDFEYICGSKGAANALARQWRARGQTIRYEFAMRTKAKLWKGADQIEWKRETALAKAWKDVSIEQRARAANLLNYYELPYRHGSSFEHSDSWAAASFVALEDEGSIGLMTGPGSDFVAFALLAGAFALAQMVKTMGDFYDFDFDSAGAEMETILRTAFPESTRPS